MTEENLPALRLSDAERERAVSVLRDAVAEGRLTLEEFSDRVGAAQLTRTAGELEPLLADLPATRVAAAVEAPGLSYRAFMSRLVRGGRWELATRSSFRSIFGTIDLDLRQATLHGEPVEIDIFNLFGTVTVIVPEGIHVDVSGGGLFASQVIQPPSAPPAPGAPRLQINARGPGGTLYVRSTPRR